MSLFHMCLLGKLYICRQNRICNDYSDSNDQFFDHHNCNKEKKNITNYSDIDWITWNEEYESYMIDNENWTSFHIFQWFDNS